MKILKMLKRPDPPGQLQGPGARVEIYLDESTVRMCMKYQVNASEFMMKALLDELHAKAVSRESTYFERRQ